MKSTHASPLPSQHGRTVVITGATSGIGYETALALNRAGANVIIASRNRTKGAEAVSRIRTETGNPAIRFAEVDLADLDSVRACAQRIADEEARIDLLINNAGVMAIPTRHVTKQGFEMQFAANYLGHFAWTLHLLPRVVAAPAPRVVTVSSLAHRQGRIHFDDLQLARAYSPWRAYSQSKLATLLLSLELDRLARLHGWPLLSVAAHPGFALTNLQSAGPRMGRENRFNMLDWLGKVIGPIVAQPAAAGALPTLYAATSPDAQGGCMYGPDGFYEIKGAPRLAKIVPRALDRVTWQRLWSVSEQLTGLNLADISQPPRRSCGNHG